MINIIARGFASAVLLCGAACADVTATIVDYGQVAVPHIGEESAIDSSDSHSGSLFVMSATAVPEFTPTEHKDTFAITYESRFGVYVQIDGGSDLTIAPIRTRWTHPPFADGATVEEWDSPMNFRLARYAGWVIEDSTELVAGDWTVEILYRGATLTSQTFHITVAPE